MAGKSLVEIAEEVGYASPQAVHNAITTELRAQAKLTPADARQDLLQLQHDRYSYLLSKVWPQAEFGDLPSIEMARKLIGDLTKLHQLDAVDTTTQTTQVLVIGGAENEYIEKLKQLAKE